MSMIILLNAPPRSGKDEFAVAVDECTKKNPVVFKFADKLKEMVHLAYGLKVPNDYFEDVKDKPCKSFYGKTPREVYIAFSEKFIKPLHGELFFADYLADKVNAAIPMSNEDNIIIVTDTGFKNEFERFVEKVNDKCLLIRVERPGCTFDNDSREWIHTDKVQSLELYNDGSLDDYYDKCARVIENVY